MVFGVVGYEKIVVEVCGCGDEGVGGAELGAFCFIAVSPYSCLLGNFFCYFTYTK